MDNQQFNKLMGYAILAICAYFVLQFIIQYLIYGVIGLIIMRLFVEYQNNNRRNKK